MWRETNPVHCRKMRLRASSDWSAGMLDTSSSFDVAGAVGAPLDAFGEFEVEVDDDEDEDKLLFPADLVVGS